MARTVLHKAPPASDNLVKIHYHEYANHNNVNASGEVLYWRTNAFTTTTAGADLIVEGQCMGTVGASDQCGVYCMLTDNSGNGISGMNETRSTNDDNKFRGVWYAGVNHNANWSTFMFAWHKKYTNVPAGTYEITASMMGYGLYKEKIEQLDGSPIRLEILLKEQVLSLIHI